MTLSLFPAASSGVAIGDAIGGTHILDGAARALAAGSRAVSYFDYRAFCELVEAVSLHDKVRLIGPSSEAAVRLAETLAGIIGSDVVMVVESEAVGRLVTTETRMALRAISVEALGVKAPPMRVETLNRYPTSVRTSDEPKAARFETLHRQFVRSDEGLLTCDADAVAEVLRRVWVEAIGTRDREAGVLRLFRAFLFAALAREARGTVLGEGARKYVIWFLRIRLRTQFPETFAIRLNRIMNHFLLDHHIAVREARYDFVPYVPVTVAALLRKAHSVGELLPALAGLRERLRPLRGELSSRENDRSNDTDSLQERVEARKADDALQQHFSQIFEELRIPMKGVTGTIARTTANAYEQIVAPQKLTADGLKTEISGGTVTKSATAVAKTVREERLQRPVATLFDLAREAVRDEQLLARASGMFTFRSANLERARNYERITYPIFREDG